MKAEVRLSRAGQGLETVSDGELPGFSPHVAQGHTGCDELDLQVPGLQHFRLDAARLVFTLNHFLRFPVCLVACGIGSKPHPLSRGLDDSGRE